MKLFLTIVGVLFVILAGQAFESTSPVGLPCGWLCLIIAAGWLTVAIYYPSTRKAKKAGKARKFSLYENEIPLFLQIMERENFYSCIMAIDNDQLGQLAKMWDEQDKCPIVVRAPMPFPSDWEPNPFWV